MSNAFEKLLRGDFPEKFEFVELLDHYRDYFDAVKTSARRITDKIFGKKIYLRGLIEFTSFCKNDCFYCGLRHSNKNAKRYRLSPDQIFESTDEGYSLGFRTFVLQGGEDPYFTERRLTYIIEGIKSRYPDCAVTLSVGERPFEEYAAFREAGADRYLLRHETACDAHYSMLHPSGLSPVYRKICLYELKRLGYQTGAGFMVGSPFQTNETLAEDLLFIKDLEPEMIGIGPFLPQKDTPFGGYPPGSVEKTLFLISVLRLILPYALIPATTALGTARKSGREEGILCGANVLMPNLSPLSVRKKYMIYDNKITTGEESAESVEKLKKHLKAIGFEAIVDRGDFFKPEKDI